MTFGQVPPHDTAAEQCVFRGLLFEPEAFARVQPILSGEDFYETRHQLLWGVIAKANAEGTPPDATLLSDMVSRNGTAARVGGRDYLLELASDPAGLPSAALIEHHAAIVKQHSIRRKLIAAGTALAGAGYSPGLDVRAFVAGETTYLRELFAEFSGPPAKIDIDAVAPRAVDLLAQPDAPKAWVVDGLLEENCRMLLFGPSYVGKSLAATMAAICVARGYGTVLNHGVDAPPANVVLFYGEGSRRQVKNMVRTLLAGEPCPETLRLVEVHAQEPVPDLASPHGRTWYEAVLEQLEPRLAVLDTSTSLVFGDRNKAEVATGVMNWLSAMGRKHGAAFIVVHHVRKASQKGDEGSPADKAYGGQEWTALADTCVELAREKDGIRVHAWKVKDEAGDEPYLGRIEPDTLRIEFVAPLGSHTRKQRRTEPGEASKNLAKKLHECREWMTAAELADLLGVETRSINRTVGRTDFTKWTEAGFFEIEAANGPNPARYRSTGALPPELVG